MCNIIVENYHILQYSTTGVQAQGKLTQTVNMELTNPYRWTTFYYSLLLACMLDDSV